jgi:hypothetical protein
VEVWTQLATSKAGLAQILLFPAIASKRSIARERFEGLQHQGLIPKGRIFTSGPSDLARIFLVLLLHARSFAPSEKPPSLRMIRTEKVLKKLDPQHEPRLDSLPHGRTQTMIYLKISTPPSLRNFPPSPYNRSTLPIVTSSGNPGLRGKSGWITRTEA